MSKKLNKFEYTESTITIVINYIKQMLFKKLTLESSQLFLRGKDIISIAPQISGIHEPVITALINKFAEDGYDDFFIDIGANIGLTSCQNGFQFKEIHMFEPNPLLCHILEVNTSISLDKSKCVIHPIGLGEKDKISHLTVPKKNWGGAFVNDSANSYDKTVLANKDGFKSFDKNNYFNLEIKIKDTFRELRSIFKALKNKKLSHGVIKIDVEGYEEIVIKGIARALPNDMTAFIIFESWDKNFNIDDTTLAFGGRAEGFRLVRNNPCKHHWPKLIKFASLALRKNLLSSLQPIEDGICYGDIILKIKKGA